MGKKDKTNVGRAILKDRTKAGSQGKGKQSWLHTSELNDGEELNTKSVTEQTALDEFLATAELAGTEFIAEKLNISIFNADHSRGLPSRKEEERIQEIQDQHKQFLQIPRRPKWNERTTPEQLDQLEKDNFLAWRRSLAELQEKDDLILTPFERNLEFWRQLWRVIERSDVVVQIVDARNPLLFRCEDLENYVSEVSKHKVNVLLVNKADFLTQKQRETWATYFKNINVKAVFWSAVFETERLKQMKERENADEEQRSEPEVITKIPDTVLTDSHVTQFLNLKEDLNSDETNEQLLSTDIPDHSDNTSHDLEDSSLPYNVEEDEPVKEIAHIQDGNRAFNDNITEQSSSSCMDVPKIDEQNLLPNDNISENCKDDSSVDGAKSSNMSNMKPINEEKEDIKNNAELSNKTCKNELGNSCTKSNHIAGKDVEFYTSGHLLTGEELLEYCQWLHHQYGSQVRIEEGGQPTVIGLVGYPNVGKSSTINAILQSKKVPVSSTPGRTKHFQTLLVDKTICLCDCPGLVFPSFVSTKAEMVVSGILPIDQLRDHIPPVTLVCRRIPRDILEAVYGINLTKPEEWQDPNRPPYAEELLDAYGYSRGFLTSQGRSDCPRSSRYILKDYVNGKLLYCHPPSTIDPKDFQMSFTSDIKTVKKRPVVSSKNENKTSVNKMDSEFFKQKDIKSHTSATTGTEEYRRLMQASQSDPNMVIVGKPWKKHGNKNKKEKLRRQKPKGY